MTIIEPVSITDAMLVSSSVPDNIKVDNVDATGTITVANAGPAVAASGTLQVVTLPDLSDTFIVGGQTFTVVASRSGDYEVTRGANVPEHVTNAHDAIAADLSALVTAGAVVHETVSFPITAATAGAAGNSITLSGPAHYTMSGATLTGGHDAGPQTAETFVVGDVTFTFKASGTATGDVVLSAVSATAQATNIKTSLDRDAAALVSTVQNNGVLTLTSAIGGTLGNLTALTESATGMTVSGSGYLSGGVDAVDGYYEYAAGTTYADGDEVVITATHTVYESLQSANTGHAPASSPTWWVSKSKTNCWRMFDDTITSQTVYPDEMIVAIRPGVIDSLALLNCEALEISIVLDDPVEGEIYTASIIGEGVIVTTGTGDQLLTTDTGEGIIVSGYTATAKNYVFLNIPNTYPLATLRVTINNDGNNATCGFLIPGNSIYLGPTRYGAEIGIVDYSTKDQDDWGDWIITERAWSKRGTFPICVDAADRDAGRSVLVKYLHTPAVWVGNDNVTDGSCTIMTMYGWVRNDPQSLTLRLDDLELEIEGLL